MRYLSMCHDRIFAARRNACVRLLAALPVRRTPPELFALGVVLGFYPGERALHAAFMLGVLTASVGLTLRALEGSRRQARFLLLAAFGAGLVTGTGAVLAEGALSSPRFVPGTLSGVEGRLLCDSQATAKGGRLLSLRVDTLKMRFPLASGTVSWPKANPRFLLLADAGRDIETGAAISSAVSSAVSSPAVSSAVSSPTMLFATGGKLLAQAAPGFLPHLRSTCREACLDAVCRASGEASGLLKALLLGVRDDLDSSESAAFRDSGCAHILSLSGQHLSILSGLVTLVLAKIAGKKRAGKAAVAFVCLFVWLAGPSPSLLRSLLMVLLGSVSGFLDRPQSGATILSLAFAIGLLWDPPAARGLSFTLSHLAMAGLSLLAPRCVYLFEKRIPPFLASPLSAAIAATAFTAPLSVASFGVLAPVGIVVSTISGPIVLVLMWWSICAAVFCAILPPAAILCAPITEFLRDVLYFMMETGALAPKIEASAPLEKALLSSVVVAFSLYVYARPYVDHLRGIRAPPRL
ncbi:MAG: ComEC/Rec2 family competence protein [Rectinemataceae bacterium]